MVDEGDEGEVIDRDGMCGARGTSMSSGSECLLVSS